MGIGQDDFDPGRWWQIRTPKGKLLMETSDEEEARREMDICPGNYLYRIYERREQHWRIVEHP